MDSAWIFYLCVTSSRQQLLSALRARECSEAVSYIVAVAMTVSEYYLQSHVEGSFAPKGYGGIGSLRLLFNLTFPSLCVLVVMWKRHYVEIQALSRLTWSVNPLKQSVFELNIVTPIFDDSALHDTDSLATTPHNPESDDDEDEDENEKLSETTELPSGDYLQISSSIADAVRFIPPLTSAIRVPNQSPIVQFNENIHPPSYTLTLNWSFLSIIVVPTSERAFTRFKARVNQFLNAVSSSHGNTSTVKSAATYEHQREFERVKERCDSFIKEFSEWVKVLKTMVAQEPSLMDLSENSDAAAFKSSTQKNNPAMMHIATNLQVHRTIVEWQGYLWRSFTVVTFGAPACHSLKFKSGGLYRMKAKLRALEQEKMGASTTTPQNVLSQLRLEVAIACREGALIGQALGAAVASSVELLERCLEDRNENLLLQVAEIGLLIHSVCLLSTHGKEASMIEDFRGVYDILDLSLRLEKPAATAAESSSSSSQSRRESLAGNGVRVTFKHISAGDGDHASSTSNIGKIRVSLQVEPASALDWATSILQSRSNRGPHQDIQVVPVLFTLGVNEMQTIANAAGNTQLQTEVNRQGVAALVQYYDKRSALNQSSSGGASGSRSVNRSDEILPTLLAQLSTAVEAESRVRDKDVVGVLLLSCHVARLMGGARTTSCKSAKDRTSMFHTLEMVRLSRADISVDAFTRTPNAGSTKHDMHCSYGGVGVERTALEMLRGLNGVRLRNAELNIGRPKFAFNQLQLEALPMELRPPIATCGGGKS
eukprot:CAMPEP_0171692996 /NCGR_PEP_ID=MMETSP0991-20121206/6392_1 /TAXON_ID=483369 /ORGANISM="non described non described, Strain CCMP2098" /LENGTH=767 /DNA_ID=CAMNT_0012281373 /DNA_START=514 /DNA_END=2817 /DNA_ORIENTATION=+